MPVRDECELPTGFEEGVGQQKKKRGDEVRLVKGETEKIIFQHIKSSCKLFETFKVTVVIKNLKLEVLSCVSWYKM